VTRPGKRLAVVGGGMLGMRVAERAAAAGRSVTLFESAPDLGGLASVWRLGDITWDKHYHVILPSDVRTLGLLDELGLRDLLLWRSVPAGCAADGAVHPATTPAQVLRLPFLGPVAKGRLGVTALRAAALRDPLSVEDVPVLDWLRRWSGDQATERFWEPLLRSKLGANVEAASATFIATTLKRLLGARRHGGGTGDGFGFVTGGYATVLGALATVMQARGVEVRLGEQVRSVRATHPGHDGTLTVETASGSHPQFDQVVVTAASPIAARLCPDLTEAERLRCTAVTYQGIVCLSLLLPRPLTDNYITYLTEPAPFTAVIDMSALVGREQLGGHGLVYLPRYVRSDDPVLGSPEAELLDQFLPALERIYPTFHRDDVLASGLSRVRLVLPVPTLGYSRRLPPVVTSVPGLYLASSALITDGTLNVNETLSVADGVLPRVLAA
jgi:protoporphyrinogen oxidase